MSFTLILLLSLFALMFLANRFIPIHFSRRNQRNAVFLLLRCSALVFFLGKSWYYVLAERAVHIAPGVAPHASNSNHLETHRHKRILTESPDNHIHFSPLEKLVRNCRAVPQPKQLRMKKLDK